MHRILVAGHICLDLAPVLDVVPGTVPGTLSEIGPVRLSSGGCVANTAASLAALGVAVGVAADVGDDALGALLLDQVEKRSFDARLLRRTGLATSYSIVLQAPDVDRLFWHHVGANAGFDGTRVVVDGYDLLHLGYPSILPTLLEDEGRPWRELLGRARAAGLTTSLDLAVIDPRSPAATHDWPALLTSALPLVDVASPSLDDLRSTDPSRVLDSHDAARAESRRLVAAGAAVALVSDGSRGIALATAGPERFAAGGRVLADVGRSWWEVDRWLTVDPVAHPVTTSGAGDATSAALLAGLVRGLDPDATLALAAQTAAEVLAGTPGQPPA